MGSIRTFATDQLIPAIIKDAKAHLIFNERDLHIRTALHLSKYAKGVRAFVLNEPFMRIGQGRGTTNAKPDIVVCDRDGPLAAFELKCHLDSPDTRGPAIEAGILADIANLKKFQQCYDVEYVFAVVLLDFEDREKFERIERVLLSHKEPWMKHRFKLILLNMRRHIRGYSNWSQEWLEIRALTEKRVAIAS